MAYTLQAIISDEALLRTHTPWQIILVPLQQGKAMIPLCGKLIEEFDIPFLPLTDGGRLEFDEALVKFVAPLIGRGKFAYVEAEFFGGDGTQACIMWNDDGKQSDVTVAPAAINKALKFLGVSIGDCHDEFDALGLGKHRGTEDWLGHVKANAK
jgi:hypothetical protein